jgi:hypothetical protein
LFRAARSGAYFQNVALKIRHVGAAAGVLFFNPAAGHLSSILATIIHCVDLLQSDSSGRICQDAQGPVFAALGDLTSRPRPLSREHVCTPRNAIPNNHGESPLQTGGK